MRMIKVTMMLLALAITLGSAAGQSQTAIAARGPEASAVSTDKAPDGNTAAPAHTGFQQRLPRYKIAAGDSFDIAFDLNPEFNQTVTVQPDGYITLRGIGDVQVQGQTVPELTATLRSSYSKILRDPLVSVVLKDFQKPYFIADGQVSKPGKYDLRGDTSLTQAVAMAGGFLDSAKHSRVVLYRKAPDGWYEAEIIDVKKMEKEGNLREDPQLHSGDMLFVPKNKFSKIKAFLPGANMGAYYPF
jgi:polysaccharide biosynthesis/export protein